jgi:hypothetical protein
LLDTRDEGRVRQEGSSRKIGSRGASLYDDALAERTAKKKWNYPLWGVIFGLVLAGMVFSFINQPSDLELAGHETSESEASELAKAVEEARLGELGDGPEDTSDEGEGPQDRDSAGSDLTRQSEVESSQQPIDVPERSDTAPVARPVAKPEPPTERPQREAVVQDDPTPVAEEVPPAEKPSISDTEGIDAQEPAGDAAETEDALDEPAPEPGPPPEAVAAYDVLLAESEVAGKLARGEYSTLEFIDWRVVQQTDREIWIDITGRWVGNEQEVHFIWSVNREDYSLRALSQEARNLEASARRQ